MKLYHLLWIVPLTGTFGAFLMAFLTWCRREDPPFCEDCPRVEQEDPIGVKYNTKGSEPHDH